MSTVIQTVQELDQEIEYVVIKAYLNVACPYCGKIMGVKDLKTYYCNLCEKGKGKLYKVPTIELQQITEKRK